jgi:hypothetical protein
MPSCSIGSARGRSARLQRPAGQLVHPLPAVDLERNDRLGSRAGVGEILGGEFPEKLLGYQHRVDVVADDQAGAAWTADVTQVEMI